MLSCLGMTGGTSELSDDVAFDHDAAFRASWAIDETLRALDDLADARARAHLNASASPSASRVAPATSSPNASA